MTETKSPHHEIFPEMLDAIQTKAWRSHHLMDIPKKWDSARWPDVIRADVSGSIVHSYFYHKDDKELGSEIDNVECHPVHRYRSFLLTPFDMDSELVAIADWTLDGVLLMREVIDVDPLKDGAFEAKADKLRLVSRKFDVTEVRVPKTRESKSGKSVAILETSDFANESNLFKANGFFQGSKHLFWYSRGPDSWKALLNFLRS